MNDVQRKVAEQIGLLVIANAEQAAALERQAAELQRLRALVPQEPKAPAGEKNQAPQE